MTSDDLPHQVLDAAEATGHLGAHTYILFNSDHGEMAMLPPVRARRSLVLASVVGLLVGASLVALLGWRAGWHWPSNAAAKAASQTQSR